MAEIQKTERAQTHDLGNGWFINIFENHHGRESATVRNPDKGQRIDLPAESFERLRAIFKAQQAA